MIKYKKGLIILFGAIGLLLLCVILSFTLFRVHSVKLEFQNETDIFASEESKDKVIKSSGISYSTPIFGVNKTQMVQNLEKENPYIKVVNIETVFPNRLVVHCAQREETFAIKIGEMLYYIVDDELKILDIKRQSDYISSNINASLLSGATVLNPSADKGEFLHLGDGEEDVISDLMVAFAYNNKTISDFKAMIKNVDISYGNDFYTTLKTEINLNLTTFDDFEIDLLIARSNLVQKINIMLSLVPTAYNYYSSNKLIIYINPDNINDAIYFYD